jgi:hypothetical protein
MQLTAAIHAERQAARADACDFNYDTAWRITSRMSVASPATHFAT